MSDRDTSALAKRFLVVAGSAMFDALSHRERRKRLV